MSDVLGHFWPTYLSTYHVRRFLPYNVRYFGSFLDLLTYPKIWRHLWTFPLQNSWFQAKFLFSESLGLEHEISVSSIHNLSRDPNLSSEVGSPPSPPISLTGASANGCQSNLLCVVCIKKKGKLYYFCILAELDNHESSSRFLHFKILFVVIFLRC